MNLQNLIDYCKNMGEQDPLYGIQLPAPLDPEKCRSAIIMRCGLLTPVYGEPSVFREMLWTWFQTHDWTFKHLIAIIQAEYSPIENTDRYTEHSTTRNGSGVRKQSGDDIHALSGKDINEAGGTDTTSAGGIDKITAGGSDKTATSGSDINKLGGQDTTTRTPQLNDTTTDTISAENSSDYQPDSRHETSQTGTERTASEYGKTETLQHGKTDTTTYGKTDTTTYGKTDTTKYGKTDTITYGKRDTITYGRKEEEENTGKEAYTEHTHGNIGVTSNVTLILEEVKLLERFNVYSWIAERIEEEFFIMVY